MAQDRWNHNIHYQRLVLREIPGNARRALDVGCGEGILTRALHKRVPEVVGIDPDAPSIALARAEGGGVEYIRDDVLTHSFEPESFDVVASIAALHHIDATSGLNRMAELLRPGGRLVVIGLARTRLPQDLPWEIAGAATTRALKLRRGYWEHSAPTVWPPPLTHPQMRRLAAQVLPGAQYRRLVLWRYSLVWTKPAG